MTYYANSTLVDTDPDTMFKEIEASEKSRSRALANYDRLLQNAMATEEWPEALTHEYLSFMVPRIVQENPTVTVHSRVGADALVVDNALASLEMAVASGQMTPDQAMEMLESMQKPRRDAIGCQHVLRRMIEQDDDRSLLDRLCHEYLQSWSATITRPEPLRDRPNARWPKSYKIATQQLLIDPVARDESEIAWIGHWDIMPKDALMKRAEDDADGYGGWDINAIKALTPTANDKAGVDRKDVRVYEIWVPGMDLNTEGDPDIHGAILTLGSVRDGDKSRGIEIRKPRPAYVPPWGAYTVFGCYNRSTSVWPMSPLLATFMMQDELQKHARAMNINARKYRRVVIVSDANPALVQQLRSAPDSLVIPVHDEHFDKDRVVVQELGGISDQQLAMYAHMKSRFDRALGMDDAQRGKVDANATATAIAVADESVATRVSYIEGKFMAAVRRMYRTRLWYAVMDERFSLRLGADAARELMMNDPWFYGGLDPDEYFDFDDLELIVDPYSMGRVSEQALQRRVTEFIEALIQMAPMMLQFPFIDWQQVIRNITQVLNLPNMSNVIDFQQLSMLGQMQAQMGVAQQAIEMDVQRAANEAGQVKNTSNAMELVNNRIRRSIPQQPPTRVA